MWAVRSETAIYHDSVPLAHSFRPLFFSLSHMYILHYAVVRVCTIFVLQLSLSKGGRLRKDTDLYDFLCPKAVAVR